MNYAALAAEIAAPPYAGLNDANLLAALNAKTVAVAALIQSGDVRRLLMVAGKWPRIAALARGLIAGTDDEKLAAVALVEALAEIESFDLTVEAYSGAANAQLDACVAVGLIEGAHKAAILALGTASDRWVSRSFPGLAALGPADLAAARAL